MKLPLASLLVGAVWSIFQEPSSLFASAIKVGDSIPDEVALHYGFPPEKLNLHERVSGKKVLIIGLPGAFTPTWSNRQVPGYLEKEDALKELGVEEIIIYCVNDGAVMKAWSDDQGITEDSIIKLMGDPYGEVTEQLEMEMLHSGPKSVGLVDRCKRFALYVVDEVVQIVRIAEAEDDPAGDDKPDVTLADAMIDAIQEFIKNDELYMHEAVTVQSDGTVVEPEL